MICLKDIEIAQNAVLNDIVNVADSLNVLPGDLVLYGNNKAKIKLSSSDGKTKAKLILVTAINPTPFGEGKTTVSIGLGDALNRLGKKCAIVLREPSMGPVFGVKGGATGGGYSQVVPMEDINLHFTGDFHAISSANDLLAAAIDNHIYQGNRLDIQEVTFRRCLDVNDRALRKIDIGSRSDSFAITAASEIMAIFCLASSLDDLKERLGDIIIGYDSGRRPVFARDLKIEGALTVILKDAFMPNLVQTLEHTPTIIHGGPFANIAHGCNSVVATKLGMSLADYVVTEAGFGADLGAEKFLDIKCRVANLQPDCIVLVATIKALKYNGGCSVDNIMEKDNEALTLGLANLGRHIENLRMYGVPVIVSLNKYATDDLGEIDIVSSYCKKLGVKFAVSSAYSDGGEGAISLAKGVVDACNSGDVNFKLLYDDDMPLREKIDAICKKIYRASRVFYSKEAISKLKFIEENFGVKLPICVAKTQYSFSDDAKKLGAPTDFTVSVNDCYLNNGAKFVTVLLGNIMTMPGLPSRPNYERIDYVDGKIVGLD